MVVRDVAEPRHISTSNAPDDCREEFGFRHLLRVALAAVRPGVYATWIEPDPSRERLGVDAARQIWAGDSKRTAGAGGRLTSLPDEALRMGAEKILVFIPTRTFAPGGYLA